MNPVSSNKGSRIARLSAARLAAVQAVYQMKSTGQNAQAVVSEFRTHRLGKPLDDAEMVLPDGVLFEKVVTGVAERDDDLRGIIDACLADQNSAKGGKTVVSVEPLLDSILLCGAYELLMDHDTDAPIVIADYLEVTHAFYEGGESRLVNGVLDNVRKAVRDGL